MRMTVTSSTLILKESLIKRVRVSHCLFTATSVALLVPYVALLEVYIFSGSRLSSSLIEPLKSRMILYSVPAPLLLLSALFTYAHYAENKRARDAARHWFAITPHRYSTGYTLFDESGTAQNFDIVPLSTHRQTYRQTDTL